MRVVELSGKKCGRLTVIGRSSTGSDGQALWRCECECGNTTNVAGGHLRSGHTRSCGCLEKEVKSAVHKKHGKRNTRLYRIWANMKGRCFTPTNKLYKWYGGKGVSVCSEWMDFQVFYDWAMATIQGCK